MLVLVGKIFNVKHQTILQPLVLYTACSVQRYIEKVLFAARAGKFSHINYAASWQWWYIKALQFTPSLIKKCCNSFITEFEQNMFSIVKLNFHGDVVRNSLRNAYRFYTFSLFKIFLFNVWQQSCIWKWSYYRKNFNDKLCVVFDSKTVKLRRLRWVSM